MNQLFSGSINLSKLIEQAQKGHSGFSKSAKDGNVYMNFIAWVNEEPNEFGQHMSLQISSTKDLKEKEGKIYFGNAKKYDSSQPVKQNDVKADFSNVPVQQPRQQNYSNVSGQSDDLPF